MVLGEYETYVGILFKWLGEYETSLCQWISL
jgi:hypothetical protein